MAEIVPNEGLDYWVGVMLKAATQPANTYVGLWEGATASTVPAATAVLATQTGITETNFTGYARQVIAAAGWGATGAKTVWGDATVRGTTAGQVTFPAATAAYATAINGFLLATTTGRATGIALLYSNFDDTTAIASLAIGDVIKVTPTFGLAP